MKDIQFLRDGIYNNYFNHRNQFVESGDYLAHFTKASIALDILAKKEIWLGNVAYMNDSKEMANGMGLVGKVVSTNPWHESFKDALESIHPKLFKDLITRLNEAAEYYFHTYGLCLCEISKYDLSGNGYMWRNYAPENGVAIVFNNNILRNSDDISGIPVEILPLYYYNNIDVAVEIEEITKFITDNISEIRQLDYDAVKNELFAKFSYAVWSLKNPKYVQEKEWRIMTNDKLMIGRLASLSCIHKALEVKENEPRYVYKFNYEKAGFKLNDILARVIIGTCNHPEKVRELFIEELASSVDDIQSKVIISNCRRTVL